MAKSDPKKIIINTMNKFTSGKKLSRDELLTFATTIVNDPGIYRTPNYTVVFDDNSEEKTLGTTVAKMHTITLKGDYVEKINENPDKMLDFLVTILHERVHARQDAFSNEFKDSSVSKEYKESDRTSTQSLGKELNDGLSEFYDVYKNYIKNIKKDMSDERKEKFMNDLGYMLYYQEWKEVCARFDAICDLEEFFRDIKFDKKTNDKVKNWIAEKEPVALERREEESRTLVVYEGYVKQFFNMGWSDVTKGYDENLKNYDGEMPSDKEVDFGTGLKTMLYQKDLYYLLMSYQFSLKNPSKNAYKLQMMADSSVVNVINKKNDTINKILLEEIKAKSKDLSEEKKKQLSNVMTRFAMRNANVELVDIESLINEEDKQKFLQSKSDIIINELESGKANKQNLKLAYEAFGEQMTKENKEMFSDKAADVLKAGSDKALRYEDVTYLLDKKSRKDVIKDYIKNDQLHLLPNYLFSDLYIAGEFRKQNEDDVEFVNYVKEAFETALKDIPENDSQIVDKAVAQLKREKLENICQEGKFYQRLITGKSFQIQTQEKEDFSEEVIREAAEKLYGKEMAREMLNIPEDKKEKQKEKEQEQELEPEEMVMLPPQ